MRRLIASLVLTFLAPAALQAQDKIFLRDKEKPESRVIKEETARGIVAGATIPAEEIVDVEYELKPTTVRVSTYRQARRLEGAPLYPKDSDKSKPDLAQALEKYQETLKKMDPGQKFAERHLEFKIAFLTARLARETGKPLDQAVVLLREFKNKHPDSWQITQCLKYLAQLQLDQKQYAGAAATYEELASKNVPDEVRQEVRLLALQVKIRAGKHQEAEAALNQMIASLPKDSPFAGRARIAKAECLLAGKKTAEARKTLKDIIRDTTDKTLKAVAYNALGESYLKSGNLKEARWEFLWVDVVYNQDRTEHARALYNLWWIFEQLSEPERAQECRETLLNDPQFNGLEYQQRAREKKAPL